MSSSKYVNVRDIVDAIHDNDPELDTSFMLPKFDDEWEPEVTDRELENLMYAAERYGIKRKEKNDE